MKQSRLLSLLFACMGLAFFAQAGFAQTAVMSEGTVSPWQQVDRDASLTLAMERQVFMPMDRKGRIVLAVQRGRTWPEIDQLNVAWRITRNDQPVANGSESMANGIAVLRLDLALFPVGEYDVTAELKHGSETLATQADRFEIKPDDATPATAGRVAIVLPKGIQVGADAQWPLTMGVPFPQGTLFDTDHVRIVDEKGRPVPAQFSVRSRWGFENDASIRWLSVDLQSPDAPAWWPDRTSKPYALEFGPAVKPVASTQKVSVQTTDLGYRVNTGPLQFTVKKQGFNLVDDVTLNGRSVLTSTAKHGLYLVDQQGSIYRAANDQQVKLSIEEQGDLRTVIRAEGWYVKDGSEGVTQNISLPTDKLCKFITRIEAYAGQSQVRVLSTWVATFDSHVVQLRDLGLSLPVAGVTQASFGVEGRSPVIADVPAEGVSLLQHLPDRFDVQTGKGAVVATGKHSDGNVLVAQNNDSVLTVSHRETWQRFPKEITVRSDELRFHVWPANGKDHPEIDIYSPKSYHQLWFVHQGREMNLTVPWEMLFTAMRISDNPSTGVYAPAGNAMGGIYSNALGIAITSDMLLQFQPAAQKDKAQRIAHAFQQQFQALPDPTWLADSGAIGPIQPYEPERFSNYEQAASRMLKGSWNMQDKLGEYGMFLYRLWHHSALGKDTQWGPYRLYSAGHHYEPFVPWLYYARSGDPDYHQMGSATIRQLSDVGIIHAADERLEHREFHFGQRHLVGSTRHTNGMVAWGGDHAVIGHLTCYNGLMLAHYLTGDLRLREVVQEWHHTITQDRANPEVARASRWGEGRDNNNGLGELIDLYQLNHDPLLIAYIGPALKRFRSDMKNWGLPVQNVLAFSRDPVIRKQLIESAQAKASKQKPADPYKLFTGHAHESMMAMASLLTSDADLAMQARFALPSGGLKQRADQVAQGLPGAMPYCAIPDTTLYLPAFLKGLAANESAAVSGQFSNAQIMPMDYRGTRIILNETQDGPLDININGIFKKEVDLQIFGPDNQLVYRRLIPAGVNCNIILPADGKAGQYVLLALFAEGKEDLVIPVSSLPGEVYVVKNWSQTETTRFFTRLGNMPDGSLTLMPHKAKASIFNHDLTEELASTATGEKLTVPVDAQHGVWLLLNTRYVSTGVDAPLILARDPRHFFLPDPEKLNIKPLPAESQ